MNLAELIPLEWKAAIGLAAIAGLGYVGKEVVAFARARADSWFASVSTAVEKVGEIAAGQVQLQAELGRMQEFVCERIEGVHGEVMSRIELSDAKTAGTIGILSGRVSSVEMRVDAVERRQNGNGQTRP